MGSDQRLSRSKSGGTSWMATGELQMMTALIRMDGRYEASEAIVNFTDIQLFKGCFELLQSHLEFSLWKNSKSTKFFYLNLR